MPQSYLLGDDDPELMRLRAQHRLWSEATCAGWRRAGLGPGQQVLDVGCGPGFTTLDLAEWVGHGGRVDALDPSERFIDHLQRAARERGLAQVHAIRGEIADLRGAPRFDLAYARWVLCFLSEPAAAVDRIARVLRVGGRLVVVDYFNYQAFCMAPRIAVMGEIVQAIAGTWQDRGGSLEVQGDVPALCARAGLSVQSIRTVSRLARPGEAAWHWPEAFLRGFLPTLVEAGRLEAAKVEEFWSQWAVRAAEPGSYLYLPPVIEVIAQRLSPV